MQNNVIKTYKDIFVKNVRCGEYTNKKDMRRLIRYITDSKKEREKEGKKPIRYIGAYGVPYYNPKLCRDAIYIVKKYYDKMDKVDKTGKPLRSVYHFVISFPDPIEDADIVKLIAIDTCQYFYNKGFQCIYAVHEDTKHLHIHIAVNSTNFMTGKQMHFSKSELMSIIIDLKKLAYGILKENGY